jgi:hypothetical protein
MKVWVASTKKLAPFIVTVMEPQEEGWRGRELVSVVGTGDMVLVDREELRHVLEHSGTSGSRSNWCNWRGCMWDGNADPHDGTCPLREEA